MTDIRLNKDSGSDEDAYLLAHRCPTGKLGRKVAEDMNIHHGPLRKWGLPLVNFSARARILEAACGGGMTARTLLKRKNISTLVGFDLSEEMARFSRRINREYVNNTRAAFLTADVLNLPFLNHSFDGAVAFETTYFWPDIIRGISELRRVLRPGGQLLIVNELFRYPDISEEDRKIIDLLEMDVLTPDEYRNCLSEAGMEEVKIIFHPNHPWIAITAHRPGRK